MSGPGVTRALLEIKSHEIMQLEPGRCGFFFPILSSDNNHSLDSEHTAQIDLAEQLCSIISRVVT